MPGCLKQQKNWAEKAAGMKMRYVVVMAAVVIDEMKTLMIENMHGSGVRPWTSVKRTPIDKDAM